MDNVIKIINSQLYIPNFESKFRIKKINNTTVQCMLVLVSIFPDIIYGLGKTQLINIFKYLFFKNGINVNIDIPQEGHRVLWHINITLV